MKNLNDWLSVGIVVFIFLLIGYFGGSAFMDLVGGLYHWLDQFIWAFFAGVIAFFLSLWLVAIMFQITVITVSLGIAFFALGANWVIDKIKY